MRVRRMTHALRYTMHGLVRDLALYVSRDLLLIRDAEDRGEDGNYRHLVFTSMKGETSVGFAAGKTLQTISFEGVKSETLPICAKYLRTLVLRSTDITEVPPAIELLKHLRFLDLSDNPIRMLPDFICKLYQLQTLGLQGCKWLTQLLTSLIRMVNLRHILTTTPMLAPKGLAKLTKLQTLPHLALGKDGEGWTFSELGDLHELKGEIHVYGLEHVQNTEAAQNIGLGRKAKVTKLSLSWAREREETSGDTIDEVVLDTFQPHPDITLLKLRNFYGKKFPSWIMRMEVVTGEHGGGHPKPLENLTAVNLLNCSRCQTLPTLGQLPFLRLLSLSGFDVECIDIEFYVGDNDLPQHHQRSMARNSSDLPAIKAFASLKELRIIKFKRLTTWMAPSQEVVADVFPCLEFLKVVECPKLETIPALNFRSLKCLWLCGLFGLKCLDIIKASTDLTTIHMCQMWLLASLTQELANCTKLQTLEIDNFQELRALPMGLKSLKSLQILIIRSKALTSLPDDFFRGLSSLQELRICGCPKLTEIPASLEGCTSLKKLWILGCGSDVSVDISRLQSLLELVVSCSSARSLRSVLEAVQCLPCFRCLGIEGFRDEEEMRDYFSDMAPFLALQSLKELYLFGFDNIRSLPQELGLLTGITELHLWVFPDLEETPHWIPNLTSLESLEFRACSILKHLPSAQDLRRLTHLRHLTIKDSPLLAESCNKDKGSEWSKIEHLSYIQIDGTEIF